MKNALSTILIILLLSFLLCSSAFTAENEDQLAYKIKNNHPRLYITPEYLAELKKKAADKDPTWHRLLRYLEGGRFYDPMRLIKSFGIAYLVTGDEAYAREGINKAMGYVKGGRIKNLNKVGAIEGVAIAYDWFYDLLDESQKKQMIKWLNDSCNQFRNRYITAWHNYAPSLLISIGSTGYATYGDNPRAVEWLDNAYKTRFKTILRGLQISGAGGGWPESTAYGTNSVYRLLRFCEIVKSATGLDLYESTPFFRDRMSYSIHMHYPGLFKKYKQPYREFIRLGDGIRGLKGYQAYERGAQQLLARRFAGDPTANQLQYLLNERTVNYAPFSWMTVEDFMYADTVSTGSPPEKLHHFSEGSGTVFMRSDWKDSATWASFQCGDHFEYHQHLDQNSFTIYKYNDLAIDSGNYDGYGGSEHGINYYKRTVAHNSVLVYDPIEGFSKIVGGKNGMPDGGQRTMNPHSIQVINAENWYENRDAFDTGDIPRFHADDDFVYIFGDATNAYNNPRFTNTGENPKVTSFTRQFIYLRPDTFIIYDRVTAYRKDHPKKWLLHTINEPELNGIHEKVTEGEFLYPGQKDGTLTRTVNDQGLLFCRTLLPESHRVRKVGGRGVKDFWSFGLNYDFNPGDESRYGAWRIEVEPQNESNSDIFLNVLYTAPLGVNKMPPAAYLKEDTGTAFAVQAAGCMVIFNSTEKAFFDRKISSPITFTSGNMPSEKLIVADLEPGAKIDITINSGEESASHRTIANDAGIAIMETGIPGSSGLKISAARNIRLK